MDEGIRAGLVEGKPKISELLISKTTSKKCPENLSKINI